MVQRPSVFRILTNDYTGFISALVPLVVPPLWLLLAWLEDDPPPAGFGLGFLGLVALAGFGLALYRVWLIRSVFDQGCDVPATISQVTHFRDRGRLEYIYTFQGQKYLSGNAIHQTRHSTAFQPGDEVTLAIDPNRPKRAFIRQLYL